MSEAALSLKTEVEAAVLAQIERLGPSGFNKAPVIAQFRGRAPTATLYRWVDQIVKSGRPGQHIAKVVQAAAADRAAHSAAPAAEIAAEAAAMMPAVVAMKDIIVEPTGSVLDAVAQIGECIAVARQVLEYARTPDGKVRVPKMMLNAAETLRRAIQTGVELQQALRGVAETEKFHNEVITTIREVAVEHPAAAELLCRRLKAVAGAWS